MKSKTLISICLLVTWTCLSSPMWASIGIISLNFAENAANQVFDGGQLIGPLETDSAYWNNTINRDDGSLAAGTIEGLIDDTGAVTEADITWVSNVVWWQFDGTGNDEQRLAVGYLDDGDDGIRITVTNIPYGVYRVYGLISTDQNWLDSFPNRNYLVNGQWVYGGDATTDADAYGGITPNNENNGQWWTEIVPGETIGNYWTIETSGSTLTIEGLPRAGARRGTLGGLIIENMSAFSAINPTPPSGETLVPIEGTVLTWEQLDDVSGLGVYYDVYFGTEPNELSSGYYGLEPVKTTTVEPEDFYYDPGLLENATTYYWRVDAYEPNEPTPIVHVGPEWQFTTEPAEVVIMKNPTSQTVAAGEEAVLTIDARNAETYQWYKDGQLLEGQTEPTLVLENVQIADEGYYSCVASNELPSEEATSEARLMVRRMVAHWPLDGTLEAIVTNPAENWDGVYVDPNELGPLPAVEPVEYVQGPDGSPQGAVKFNGESVVHIPDSAEFFNFHPQGLTLTAWVLGPSAGNWHRPVNKGGSYGIVHQLAGWIDLIVEGVGWQNAIPAVKADVWRFVAITYDPQTQQRTVYGVYDDDSLIELLNSTVTTQTSVISGTTDLLIGGASATGSDFNYHGSVADVRVFNYALDAQDVVAVYHEMLTNEPVCLDIDDPALQFDFNRDCKVDLADFVMLAQDWMECFIYPDCY